MRGAEHLHVARARDADGAETSRLWLGAAGQWSHASVNLAVCAVLEGCGWSHCRGRSRTVHAGSAELWLPGDLGVVRADGVMSAVVLEVPRHVLPAGDRPAREREREIAADELASLCAAAVSGADHTLRQRLLALLPRPGALGAAPQPALEPGAVRRARLHLLRDLRRTISLDELAEEARTSKYHLVRVFRAYHGVPPHAYLTAWRVAAARRLLVAGARGSDVAVATGFADQSHFSRTFRRLMGISPQAYARLAPGPSRPEDTAAP